MGKKSEAAEVPRKGVNTRITDSLRRRIERSAADSNRTVGSDIEHRLELSFRFDLVGDRGLGKLAANQSASDFISTLGKAFADILSLASERGLSEVEAREALRGALEVLASRYLWTGGALPDAEGVVLPVRTKIRELPPAELGQHLAAGLVSYDAALRDQPIIDDTFDERVANRWTGDGSRIERGDPPKPRPTPQQSGKTLEEIETDPHLVGPKNTNLYAHKKYT